MPAIENKKPSWSAQTEGNDQGNGVIQGLTTAVTNLPSGLDVIANAAANVDDVQVLPKLSLMMFLKSALFWFHHLMHPCIPFLVPKSCMHHLKKQSTRCSQQSKEFKRT
jgi:hypothetical protein